MTRAIREAIEAADAEALRALVTAEPSLAAADVVWGPHDENAVHPVHFVCDALSRGLATQEQALRLADVLLAAGVDLEHAHPRTGDTLLVAAASLGAEAVGCRLVERGADVSRRGLFGATALHWAAILGLEALVRALLDAGADLELADERYESRPLGWALHGWNAGTSGRREALPGVVRLLTSRGARVPAGATATLVGEEDAPLREALEGGATR